MEKKVSAEVINCPGRLGDSEYQALQIHIEGFDSPFVLTLALPAVGCRALSKQANPAELYRVIAEAINVAKPRIAVDEVEPMNKLARVA